MKYQVAIVIFVGFLLGAITARAENAKPQEKAKAVQPTAEKAPSKAPASDPFDEPLEMPTHFKKGWKVEIFSYDAGADVFEMAPTDERESGPFYFTPEEFLKGTGFKASLAELTKQKKKDLVGSEHVLVEDMRFLTIPEYENRGR